jgi:hypothetical protein
MSTMWPALTVDLDWTAPACSNLDRRPRGMSVSEQKQVNGGHHCIHTEQGGR